MRKNDSFLGFWLIAPAMAILLFFNIYPFIETIRLSFFQYVLTKPKDAFFIGFANYADLFRDSTFWNSLKITIIYVFITVSVELLIGFWLASILNSKIQGRNFFTSIFIIPMTMSPVVVGLFWRAWFAPDYGPIGYYLKKIGLGQIMPPAGFLGTTATALPAVIIVDIWQWTSFVVLILLAGLRSLPDEPFEAAEVDGATTWQKLIYITIPLLKRVLLVVLLFRTVDSFRIFDTVWLMTKGGPGAATETLSILIYKTAFYYWNIGFGTATTLIVLIIVLVIANILIRATFRER